MKIQQNTSGRLKEYIVTGKEREPIVLFEKRIFGEYPRLGYGTMSSGIRWNEPDGYWSVRITHSLSCD
ncbi:MAG: hypothetical protein ACPF8W_05085 [Luminiphilus sp.]